MTAQFLRYASVGALATAVHYALLVIGVEAFSWPAFAASGFGAVVGEIGRASCRERVYSSV